MAAPEMMGKWKTTHSFPPTFRDWFYHDPLPQVPVIPDLGGRAGSDTAPHPAGFTRPRTGQAQLVEATMTIMMQDAVSIPIPGDPRGIRLSDTVCQRWRSKALSCLQRHEDARRVWYGTWNLKRANERGTTHENSRCLDPQHFKAPPSLMLSKVIKPIIFYMHLERIGLDLK